MSVKIGKVELSILDTIFLLLFVLGFFIFYGTMVNNPNEFSTFTILSLILMVVGFLLFFISNYKKCYVPETAPMKKFEDMAYQIETQNVQPNPQPPAPQPIISEELKKPSEEPKNILEEDVGDDLLEEETLEDI